MSGSVALNNAATDANAGLNTTTLTVLLTGVVAGDTLHAFMTWDNSNPGVTVTVSDPTNGTWATLDTIVATNAQEVTAQASKQNVAASSTLLVTMTLSGANVYKCISVYEVSGVAAASLDKHTGQLQTAPTTAANAVTTGNMTPASQPGVLIALSNDNDDVTLRLSIGTGFTTLGQTFTVPGHQGLALAEWKRFTALTAIGGTFTASLSPNDYVTMGALYLEPATSAPTNGIFFGSGTTS
jgi:hypothetical protein